MDEKFTKSYASLEQDYPGITEQIWGFNQLKNPRCIRCGTANTAFVRIGVIGRTMAIRACTNKVKFVPWAPRPGWFYCNLCRKFFTPAMWYEEIRDLRADNQEGGTGS